MRRLTVTAHLVAGYSASDPWSPALDGILAWAWMRRHHPERLAEGVAIGAADILPLDDLPLARDHADGLWWYLCSSPRVDAAARIRRHYHRRFDDDIAGRRLDDAVAKVPSAAGPYKGSRLQETVIMTDRIVWHAVGHPFGIHTLLRAVPSIGRGVARGLGRVRGWSVEDAGSRGDHDLRRPLPERVAAERGLTGPVMLWGLRPPARINVIPCVMPEPLLA